MTSLHDILTRLVAAVLFVVIGVGASAAHADDITLHSQVTLSAAGPIKLKQVASLQGEIAEKLGETIVGQLEKSQLSITRQDVRSRLDAAGVNWGRLSLKGFVACQVTLQVASESPAVIVEEASASAAAVANPSQPIRHDSALTLRDRVIETIVRHAGQSKDDLRITFNARDQHMLAQSVLTDRWEIEPTSAAKAGRILLTIRRWQEDRITQTYRIGVDVACRSLAVVALRDIRRGETIASSDVEIQEVYLTELLRTPATDLAAVVGRIARDAFNKGQVIYASEAARPELVKRGDRLVVRCIVGGLVIKINARAMEGGSMDDIIAVANIDSNERLQARVTGTREAILVDHAQASGTQVAVKEHRHD